MSNDTVQRSTPTLQPPAESGVTRFGAEAMSHLTFYCGGVQPGDLDPVLDITTDLHLWSSVMQSIQYKYNFQSKKLRNKQVTTRASSLEKRRLCALLREFSAVTLWHYVYPWVSIHPVTSCGPSSFVQETLKLPVSVPKPIIDVCIFPSVGCVIHCPWNAAPPNLEEQIKLIRGKRHQSQLSDLLCTVHTKGGILLHGCV